MERIIGYRNSVFGLRFLNHGKQAEITEDTEKSVCSFDSPNPVDNAVILNRTKSE